MREGRFFPFNGAVVMGNKIRETGGKGRNGSRDIGSDVLILYEF